MLVPIVGMVVMSEAKVYQGSADLQFIRATDGKVLFSGFGFGESEGRKTKGVVRKIRKTILNEVYGPPAY